MPIYHFNLFNHVSDRDEEGTELPDDETARIEAVRFAGAHLHDHPELVWDGERFAVDVTDHSGRKIFAVTITAKAETDLDK